MKALKDLRLQHNKTQKDVADELGISQQAYANYESFKREPDYKTLVKLADFFNVSIDYLLGRNENKSASVSMDKGAEDEIIFHRDGKTVRRKAKPGKEQLLQQLLEELTEDSNERL